MLRSRIARTNSKLEIFTGLVDCRQKKFPSCSKSLLLDLHFTFFISFTSRQNYLPFFIYRLTAPCPHRFRTLVSFLLMMPCTEALTFFMGFGFFQGFKVSNSDTWGQNIFSIYKTFTPYFWFQNAHNSNTKMQLYLITIVRRFFFLIWPWTRSCGWIFCLQHNVSVDFVNPQGMAILGKFTCGYMGYIHRGLWPLYFWPTHLQDKP